VPLAKKIDLVAGIRASYFGPFRNALRTMHQISLRLFAPTKTLEMLERLHGDIYMLVKENGVIDIASEGEVLKHADIAVTSM
jgi:hypothetical protein